MVMISIKQRGTATLLPFGYKAPFMFDTSICKRLPGDALREKKTPTHHSNKTPITVQSKAKLQTEPAFCQSRTQKAWKDRSPSLLLQIQTYSVE